MVEASVAQKVVDAMEIYNPIISQINIMIKKGR